MTGDRKDYAEVMYSLRGYLNAFGGDVYINRLFKQAFDKNDKEAKAELRDIFEKGVPEMIEISKKLAHYRRLIGKKSEKAEAVKEDFISSYMSFYKKTYYTDNRTRNFLSVVAPNESIEFKEATKEQLVSEIEKGRKRVDNELGGYFANANKFKNSYEIFKAAQDKLIEAKYSKDGDAEAAMVKYNEARETFVGNYKVVMFNTMVKKLNSFDEPIDDRKRKSFVQIFEEVLDDNKTDVTLALGRDLFKYI